MTTIWDEKFLRLIQRSMNILFVGLLNQGMIIYIDDSVSYGSTFTEKLE